MFLILELLSVLICLITLVNASDYYVVITNDSPVVRGGTVHFVAKLYDEYGNLADGTFKYEWEDNSMQHHVASHKSASPIDEWNVTYPADNRFPPGPYEVQVTVYKSFIVFYMITSQRATFRLTEHLNGHMKLEQKNKSVTGKFVSNAEEVIHKVVLNSSDAEYLNTTATSVLTYWFVDCAYYGFSNDYTFVTNYPETNKRHKVEALVIAGYEPITTPAPPTTTSTTTTTKPTTITTKKASTTAAPKTTPSTKGTTTVSTAKPKSIAQILNNSVDVHNKRFRRKTSVKDNVNATGTSVPYDDSPFPFVCDMNNTVAPDVHKTYGYFSTKFAVKAPVANISVTGNYWLQQGDVLGLLVKCHGTPQFYYCKHVFEGVYNVTGNETCDVPTPDSSDKCEFPIKRFLRKPQKYTIVIVIYNDVGKIVSPVTVTVYEVKQQAQLSVIVVPVVFSLVAVVLIVFGVAYYVQNRSRFTVEVADFNFGQGSDMEYKTFTERLKDSITNAFMRAPSPSSSEPTVWPPGRKYGSLT